MAPRDTAGWSDPLLEAGTEENQALPDDGFEYQLPVFALGSPFGDDDFHSEPASNNQDPSVPAQAEPAHDPENYTYDPVEFYSYWLNEPLVPLGHDLFASVAPLLIPPDDADIRNTNDTAQDVQNSETIQNSGTLPNSLASTQSEGLNQDSTVLQSVEPLLPSVSVENELFCHNASTSPSVNSKQRGDIESHRLSESRTAQALPPVQNNSVANDTEQQGPGHEWKTVNRKALLPGCAVYAPNERKRQRGATPQAENPLPRGSKCRKKSGDVCARCKLYREKCSGAFPCERCTSLDGWQHLCARATFSKDTAFNNGLYKARALILLHNVKRWHSITTHPPIEIKVGVGFPPALPIQVNAFEAIDAKLLQHVNFRNLTSAFLRTTETQPFGVYTYVVKNGALDDFFDQLLPYLLADQFTAAPDGFSRQVFRTAYRFSCDSERVEAPMLKNTLRVWAAQNIFFGRIWRLSEGGERVGALMHPEIGAYDAPRFLYWQLDCIAERYAYEQEFAVLKDLESFMFARKKAPWLSVVLASYIYLTVLERDTWNLKSWKIKSERWANDPRVANNPTMVWPLIETPESLIEKNEGKARLITNHIRTISRGSTPFYKDVCGSVKANVKSKTTDVEEFTNAIKDDFDALNQHLLLSRSCSYSEDDWNSLDYKFSRMIIDATD